MKRDKSAVRDVFEALAASVTLPIGQQEKLFEALSSFDQAELQLFHTAVLGAVARAALNALLDPANHEVPGVATLAENLRKADRRKRK